jgi:hypothetical protein
MGTGGSSRTTGEQAPYGSSRHIPRALDETACRPDRLPTRPPARVSSGIVPRGNAIHSPADDVRIVGAQGHSACMVMHRPYVYAASDVAPTLLDLTLGARTVTSAACQLITEGKELVRGTNYRRSALTCDDAKTVGQQTLQSLLS